MHSIFSKHGETHKHSQKLCMCVQTNILCLTVERKFYISRIITCWLLSHSWQFKHIPGAYSYGRVHSVFSTSVQIFWEQWHLFSSSGNLSTPKEMIYVKFKSMKVKNKQESALNGVMDIWDQTLVKMSKIYKTLTQTTLQILWSNFTGTDNGVYTQAYNKADLDKHVITSVNFLNLRRKSKREKLPKHSYF